MTGCYGAKLVLVSGIMSEEFLWSVPRSTFAPDGGVATPRTLVSETVADDEPRTSTSRDSPAEGGSADRRSGHAESPPLDIKRWGRRPRSSSGRRMASAISAAHGGVCVVRPLVAPNGPVVR